ncbi:hypothetical protein DFO70_107374 [Cytobacillus firmus]|uniref:Uncharacterized protein n=2 Tax=Cytobacillus TaxID=2675230 RepID=A0A366JTY5_CYTFI|nr:hypothetical protein DFO70_107374 [Cytobacillus firmus]TDX41878.1 hypothetical protein DFO72_10736 [Cytobacillus oceanisediminis]
MTRVVAQKSIGQSKLAGFRRNFDTRGNKE